MARVPIHAMKARKPPILDHYVQASIDGGRDDAGHYKELLYGGVEDAERAREIRRALFRSAKHLGVSLKCDVEPAADGTHAVRFHAIDKTVARAHIAHQAEGDPSRLAYNPYGAR
jgi:hypothetical protein